MVNQRENTAKKYRGFSVFNGIKIAHISGCRKEFVLS
jgi:hypothetical protein